MVRWLLCHINPALNATPDTDSLLYAAGVEPHGIQKTVIMAEALKRVHRCLPELTADVVSKIGVLIASRNNELHSDEASISCLSQEDVMPSVYSLMVVASRYANLDVANILGKNGAIQAKTVAEAITKDRKNRVRGLINACKERFFALSHFQRRNKKKKRANKSWIYFCGAYKRSSHIKGKMSSMCS